MVKCAKVGIIVWFTGLSGAGKSTIALATLERLRQAGRPAYYLDGDIFRQGLSQDLGFTAADRAENVRRAGEVARLFADAGFIVVCAFTAPSRDERAKVRARAAPYPFVEVFVDASLAVCEQRDPKGLYAKYRAGLITQMVGIDLPYEAPAAAEIVLTPQLSPEQAAERIIDRLSGSA